MADHTFRGDVEDEDDDEDDDEDGEDTVEDDEDKVEDDEDKVDDEEDEVDEEEDEDTSSELRFGVTHLAIAVGVAHFWLRVDHMIGQFFNGPVNNVSTKNYNAANKSSDISD